MIIPGLVLLGCGGHARSVAEVALSVGIPSLLFVDKAAKAGERMLGFDVVSQIDVLPEGWRVIPAAGDNATRQHQIDRFDDRAFHTLVADDAHVAASARLGTAVFVGHFVHIGPLAEVGEGAIINNGAIVEHDCRVGRFCHVSVRSTLAGSVRLGERVFIGAGATVMDGITIGDDVVVGTGAAVVHDLPTSGTYVGVPARPIVR